MANKSVCDLCGRCVPDLTRHHLIPKSRHKNKKNKRAFDRMEVRTRLLWLCQACHDNIHAVLTEKELESRFNTFEQLATHAAVAKFTEWVRTKPAQTRVRMKRATGRRGR